MNPFSIQDLRLNKHCASTSFGSRVLSVCLPQYRESRSNGPSIPEERRVCFIERGSLEKTRSSRQPCARRHYGVGSQDFDSNQASQERGDRIRTTFHEILAEII